MSKLADVLFKVGSLVLIFIAPVIYLLWKYNKTNTRVVEVTTNSMPIFIVIILSIFALMAVSYLFSNTMAMMKEHPFGYSSIIFFGAFIVAITIVSVMWIDKISDLIDYDTTRFLSDLAAYKHSMWIILAYVISGLVVATTGIIIKKTR